MCAGCLSCAHLCIQLHECIIVLWIISSVHLWSTYCIPHVCLSCAHLCKISPIHNSPVTWEVLCPRDIGRVGLRPTPKPILSPRSTQPVPAPRPPPPTHLGCYCRRHMSECLLGRRKRAHGQRPELDGEGGVLPTPAPSKRGSSRTNPWNFPWGHTRSTSCCAA